MDDPDTILSALRARRQRHAQRTAEQLEDMQREVAAFSGSPLARHDSEPVLSPRIARRTPSRPVAEQSDDELRAQLAALKREEPRLAAPAERRAAAAEAAADRLRAELAVADREVRASRAAREQLLHAEQRAHVSGVAQASVLAELAAAREGAAALREQLRTREGRSSRRTGAPRRRRRARRRRPRRSRRRRAGWRVRTRSSATGGRR